MAAEKRPWSRRFPLGRLCTPEDNRGRAAVYLASDDAAFVTGIVAAGRWRQDGRLRIGAAVGGQAGKPA